MRLISMYNAWRFEDHIECSHWLYSRNYTRCSTLPIALVDKCFSLSTAIREARREDELEGWSIAVLGP
jgi:hypothetical protein